MMHMDGAGTFNAGSRPWYRHRWPWLLMAGPALVMVAGTVTAWLAFSHQDALVVDDYYKQGKAINQDLRRDRVATGLGLAGRLGYDPAAGMLVGSLSSLGQPYTGKISLRLVHPTQPGKDIVITLEADARGRFEAPLALLELAQWQVQLEGAGREWRLRQRWAWPQQRSIELRAE